MLPLLRDAKVDRVNNDDTISHRIESASSCALEKPVPRALYCTRGGRQLDVMRERASLDE